MNYIPERAENGEVNLDCKFTAYILNGMYDWVRVIDRNNRVIYANKAMVEGIGKNPRGRFCYEVLGRDSPCENCISRKAVFEGFSHEKEEVIGNRIFSVMSSPVRDEDGKINAVVEVLRDVTHVKQLQEQLARQNEKFRQDLEMAKRLQSSMLPGKFSDGKLSFSFVYRPCETLGGDFLDIFPLDENRFGIYIADVSGHGVSAAMLTVFLRSTLDRTLSSPAAALTRLYREYNAARFDPDLYITVFYAVLDLEKRTMTYSNAGHGLFPVVYGDGRIELLISPGIPISSWLEEARYEDKSLSLNPGDRIFLYTDGIMELKNSRKEQFGDKRILDRLLGSRLEPQRLLEEILKEACEFAGIADDSNIPDDIAMALVEVK